MRMTDVVKNLIIINVLMYFGTLIILKEPSYEEIVSSMMEESSNLRAWGRFQLAIFFPTSDFFRPYQIVTHMFMHSDIRHLFFNMFGLYMFGSALEALWGSRRFLFYYLFCGLGASVLQMLVMYLQIQNGLVGTETENIPMLGASGAIFGLLAGYGLKFPNNLLQFIFPPITMRAKYFVLLYAGVELFFGVSGFNTGIAHFAHLGGALFGLLIILYWQKFGSRL